MVAVTPLTTIVYKKKAITALRTSYSIKSTICEATSSNVLVCFTLILSANGPRKQSSDLMGLHAVFKADLLARSWLALPEQLDHGCIAT